MALAEYEVDGQTYQFDDGEHDPFRPKTAKKVGDVEPSAPVVPAEETVQAEDAELSAVPEDADPEPVDAGHKRGRRAANKAAAPAEDK